MRCWPRLSPASQLLCLSFGRAAFTHAQLPSASQTAAALLSFSFLFFFLLLSGYAERNTSGSSVKRDCWLLFTKNWPIKWLAPTDYLLTASTRTLAHAHTRMDRHIHTHTRARGRESLATCNADLAAYTVCLEWLTFPSVTAFSINQTHIYQEGCRHRSPAMNENTNTLTRKHCSRNLPFYNFKSYSHCCFPVFLETNWPQIVSLTPHDHCISLLLYQCDLVSFEHYFFLNL